MANTMKAAVFEAVKVVKVKEVPIPEIGDNEVLIKVKLPVFAAQTGAFTTAGIPPINCP